MSKQEFRHWIDTIDTNLNAAHNFKFPEMVLDKVKRSEVEVNESNWKNIIEMVNKELPENRMIEVDIAKGKDRGQVGFPGGPDPWYKKKDLLNDCVFDKKSRFLYTFLLSRLNTELHGKTLGIEGRNGFKLHGQVVRAVDEIPDNAKFLMCADISNLVHKFGDKVKDLKSLYGLRLLVKKRAAEYKKTIGQ